MTRGHTTHYSYTHRYLALGLSTLGALFLAACNGASPGVQGHLTRYTSCDELDKARSLADTRIQLYNDPMPMASDNSAAEGGSAPLGDTNLQVSSVDEMDVAKADGDVIYTLSASDATLKVLRRSPAATPTVLQSLSFENGFYASGLFITQDQVLVVGHRYTQEDLPESIVASSSSLGALLMYTRASDGTLGSPKTKLLDAGNIVDARLIQDRLHLITRKDIAQSVGKDIPTTMARTPAKNSAAAILPAQITSQTREPLTSCQNIYRVVPPLEPITMSDLMEGINILPPDDGIQEASFLICAVSTKLSSFEAIPTTTCLTTNSYGATLYASEDHAFVAVSDFWPEQHTPIHQFALAHDDQETTYVGTAVVKGRLLNRFAMDEYKGYLRVASTEFDGRAGPVNTVRSYQLHKGGDPELSAVSDPLAPNETITGVRFIKERAYVVTFERVDPLFILDLSQPDAIITKGELKVTGFSEYLHPAEEGFLIGIGREVSEDGFNRKGVLVSLFDVRDDSNPTLVAKAELGDASWTTEVGFDAHAFRYIPEAQTVVLPIFASGWNWNSGGTTPLSQSGYYLIKLTNMASVEQVGYVSDDSPLRSFYHEGVLSLVGQSTLKNKTSLTGTDVAGELSF